MKKAKAKLAGFAAFIFALQVIGAGIILSFPTAAEATTIKTLNFSPEVSIPNSEFKGTIPVGTYNEGTGKISSSLIGRYVKAFYDYGIAIAGIVATLVLMGAGVLWMVSGGDSGKVSKAKEMIAGSIVGLVILTCAYVILNTINPSLVKFKSITMTGVEEVSLGFCCDQTQGNLPTDKDGKCASGVLCGQGSTCIDAGGSEKNSHNFTCINKADYGCCEYEYPGTGSNEGKVYCMTVKKGNPCPSTSPKQGYTYNTYYPKWCETGNWNWTNGDSLGCLDKKAPCANADDRSDCVNSRGASGLCYNRQCWTGTGKEGEPCGNESGSKCYKGKASNMCPDYYSHDSGGRNCGGGLYCCYSTPNDK